MATRPIKPTISVPKPIQETRVVETVSANGNLFRPLLRPPMALLEVLDDGAESGEKYRLRSDRTTVGRENCEINVGHDSQISAKHISVSRRQQNGEWQWWLTDVGSRNGTFLRVSKCSLSKQHTILMGAHRYRFQSGNPPSESQSESSAGTQGWQVPTEETLLDAASSLVRVLPDGTEQMFSVSASDLLIGRDSNQCQLVIGDDPMIDGLHARLLTDGDKPQIEDLKSTNGLWVSVKERRLAKSSTFQIGEQRIRFRVL